MNNGQLQELTEKVSLESFKKPFLHQAVFNYRLKTTGGRYLLQSHNIEINPKHYTHFGDKELIGILKHELCHYHLHIEGRGYKHKDREFKELLLKVGGARHCSTLPSDGDTRLKLLYVCLECRTQFSRQRRINLEKYVCGKCKGKLKKVEK
ncbi:SprT family protein [Thalassorhabdus alkalitolerans]|uniref:Protein SprT-like n=1 Tax=Thalassorhabdus alkalitolerans TaxID=2282697 RepID=A0ABW0YRR4_9BACI